MQKERVSLTLVNILGQIVSIVDNQLYMSGTQIIDFNTDELSNGNYFYILQTENEIFRGKIQILR